MTQAVIVIDMVKDFVTGKLKTERGEGLVPKVKRLLDAARRSGRPVIYVNDAHLPVDGEISIWGEHSMIGSEDAEVIEELKPQEKDYVLGKRTYSAFYETGLDPLLRELKVDTVVLAGLHTNICARHTAADAFFIGYKVVVPEDGVEAFTEKDHREGLEYLKKIYGAKLTKIEKLVKQWLKD